MKSVQDVLNALRSEGITLSLQGENLKIRSTKGPLSPELRNQVKAFKSELVAFLKQAAEVRSDNEPAIKSAPRNSPLPLSFSQERLAFLYQLQDEGGIYNISTALALEGQLNVSALSAALGGILNRHEVFRTRIHVGENAHQIIDPPSNDPFELNAEPLVLEPEEDEEQALARLIAEDADTPFDITEGPLWRAKLLRHDANRHTFLFNMHHIISDGWSLGVLIRELITLYSDFVKGQSPSLPPLPIQYADYAYWQRQTLGGETLERQMDFWRQSLSGAPPLLTLPWDRPRPSIQSFKGALLPIHIPRELQQGLNSLAKAHEASLFMVLLSGFSAMMHRLSGQDTLCIGSPIANRTRSEMQGLIGLFMNTIVLRSQVTPELNFQEMLSQVKETTLSAYAHQDLPFDRVVEALKPKRSLSHEPLFQVMLILQNTPRTTAELPDLKIRSLPAAEGISKFDLTLALTEGEDGLKGTFEYNTDLFDKGTVKRFATHYMTLLESIIGNPDQQVNALPLLSAQQQTMLLEEFNDTVRDLPSDTSMHAAFERHASETPQAPAISFNGRSLSYGELNQAADRLAGELRKRGISVDSRVALYMPRSNEMVISLLGILKAGGAYLPMDPTYPADRLAHMAQDSQADLILMLPGQTLSFDPTDMPVLPYEASLGESIVPQNVSFEANRLAYLIYTSGSSGRPKGVMVNHRNVVNFYTAMNEVVGDQETSSWLAVTSISFDISVLEIFWTLSRGDRVVIQADAPKAPEIEPLADQDREMAFSMFYFASDTSGSDDKYKLLMEGATFADANDFDGVWVPERHFHAFGGQFPNPAVAAAAVATRTERVAIHSGSVVAPLHDPIRIAEEWAMVDNLSKGRVRLSFASGWHPNDFVFESCSAYENRQQDMFETIETVRHLWTGGKVTRKNGVGKEIEVGIYPEPIQKSLPVWVTSGGNIETFRSAGRIGANVLTHMLGQDIADLAERIEIYREARQEAGFDPNEGKVTLMLHTFVGEDLETVREKVAEPFKAYLRSSLNLMKPMAEALGFDMKRDAELLVETGFSRYFGTAALMGTPQSCLPLVRQLKQIGVDEIGCLIDFGMPVDEAIANFGSLNKLRSMVAEETRLAQERSSEEPTTSYRDIAQSIIEENVTHLQCTPSLARMLLEAPQGQQAIARLHKILVGGEALPKQLLEDLKEAGVGGVFNMYGPTETTIWSTVKGLNGAEEVTIGFPIANTRTYVLDQLLNPTPIGVPGSLMIAGDGVTRGYQRRPALTASRFLPDPYSPQPGGRMYDTGDQVRHLPNGELLFLGRSDDQVKLSGFRIEPGEIEAVLNRNENVRESVVTLHTRDNGVAELVAHVAPTVPVVDDLIIPLTRFGPQPEKKDNLYTLNNDIPIYHNDSRQVGELYDEIFRDEIYLRHGVEFRGHDIIVDVGSNIGSFTIFAHHKTISPTIYSFEPIPPTFAMLEANCRLHGVQGKVFNMGISNRAETAEFTYYPHMSGLSGRFANPEQDARVAMSLVKMSDEAGVTNLNDAGLDQKDLQEALKESYRSEQFQCSLMTISDLIRQEGLERIDVLKVDIERSELLALQGIEDAHWPMIRQLTMEVDGRDNLSTIEELLTEKGFQVAIDDFIIVEGDENNPELLVYMLYAVRPEEQETPSPHTSRARLEAWMGRNLPEYMIPSRLVFVEDMPRTPNGKVNKRALSNLQAGHRQSRVAYVPPSDDNQQKVAAVWQEVLGRDRIGVDDNFFELGGNSLLLTRVFAQLQKVFNKSFPLVTLFRYPTIATLATYLAKEPEATAEKPAGSRLQNALDRGSRRKRRRQ